mgnify:FL=1
MPTRGFDYRFKVRLHDIDAAGVMFYGHLFRHAHDAYEGFMSALRFPLDGLVRAGCRLPLVHAEADFLMPMHHGEEILVEVGVEALGGARFTLTYGFQDRAGALRARARTVHVHLAEGGTGPAPLPEDLRAALAAVPKAGPALDAAKT